MMFVEALLECVGFWNPILQISFSVERIRKRSAPAVCSRCKTRNHSIFAASSSHISRANSSTPSHLLHIAAFFKKYLFTSAFSNKLEVSCLSNTSWASSNLSFIHPR
eukprot:TRINITY_DN3082_c0_g2_i1.p1 TRINITY_DN3082_c0_g2~~TRINITY_DN3082_c0_g2_i1.p1  ORF type:complete len:107 (-),score=14.96 TRINITY_DN3082_c0_g2_i1:54-374(-)